MQYMQLSVFGWCHHPPCSRSNQLWMLTETHYLSQQTRNHQWKWPSIIWILSRTQSNNDEPQPEGSKRHQRTKSKLKDWMRPLLFSPALSVSKKHGPFEVYFRSVHWWHLQSQAFPQPYSDTLQTTRQGLMDKYRQEWIFFSLEAFK